MTILVTGGAGYIGSHTVLALLQAGESVLILDNLSNASAKVLPRLEQISGQNIPFVEGDIRDRSLLQRIFAEHNIHAVMHFAGLKAVGESVREPLRYYDNNVAGSLILAEEMARAGVFNLVFSSSATVYGDPQRVPIDESMPTGATTNPYGTSKHMVERLLADIAAADSRWSMMVLRYFNPIGADPSGLIGEHPNGMPNNLLPYICQVAVGKLPHLSVFGADYPTVDGTGMRDYIHVVDLADGHVKVLQRHQGDSGCHTYNLGTGQGYSVLQIIAAFEAASGRTIPYRICPRRDGDIAVSCADPGKARQHLGWQARHDLAAMMRDSWRWQSTHPNGYDD